MRARTARSTPVVPARAAGASGERPAARDPMLRVARVVLLATVAAGAALVASTLPLLPAQVPTHFGRAGAADAFMPRAAYTALALLLVAAVPCVVAAALAQGGRVRGNTRLVARFLRARPRSVADPVTLAAFGGWLGAGLALALATAHLMIVMASRSDPPRVDPAWLEAGALLALCAVAAWIALLRTRFERRPE